MTDKPNSFNGLLELCEEEVRKALSELKEKEYGE
jgi:hypothetical protein